MSGLISNNPNEVQFHIKTKAGEVGRYNILPGDPGRVRQIAQYLDMLNLLPKIVNILPYRLSVNG